MDQESIATGSYVMLWASWVAQTVKNLPAMQETIPGLGRSSGEGHGNPLQYSCLGNLMDRGVQGVTKSRLNNNKSIAGIHHSIKISSK